MKLQIRDLSKQFDGRPVLDHVSMELESGHIYCLMAPSGKGKTTLFRILMGLESADGGQILTEWEAGDGREFAGRTDGTRLAAGAETVWNRGKAALCGIRIAAVFQEDRLLEQLDAAGNLRFALGAAYDEAAARALLAELGLGDAGGKRVRDWSGGMKRRLALARALLAPSDALALDEPFTGLDADNRAAAQRCVARAAREKIVLLVSHEDDALTGAEVRLQ